MKKFNWEYECRRCGTRFNSKIEGDKKIVKCPFCFLEGEDHFLTPLDYYYDDNGIMRLKTCYG
ncbi:MAG: hypothetical protein JG781_1394 [Peptococcaceae bacterium]|jgi:hypothetical protein|uniref:Zinc ribbon domain-containing protein n=1 Tax=Thermanaerosceptrum fracticalcis TaxID=1712410 RepID=A0A7G6E4H5_THEFR|nr:hypothetical protein [Thermanaerosceptrum fracticalcis]MBZ4654055.1 hypothetical protein [Peptococcaceae bacterium]QNB46979.1 hypothetical protein BR63_12085 [Thermanaerosceptrum fracticalcis]